MSANIDDTRLEYLISQIKLPSNTEWLTRNYRYCFHLFDGTGGIHVSYCSYIVRRVVTDDKLMLDVVAIEYSPWWGDDQILAKAQYFANEFESKKRSVDPDGGSYGRELDEQTN